MKSVSMKWWFIGGIIVIGILFLWSLALQKSDPNVVATNGIHWHPQLHIYVDGEEQLIPENVGLIGEHQPMHTHVEDAAKGVLHFEFEGRVKKDDTRLGRFFDIWGKDIRSFGENIRMTVNGKENTEYEKYIVHEQDVIELYYEAKKEI